MQQHLKLLGWKVKDRVTGFTGVVTHIGVDLYGCVQAIIQPEVVSTKGEQKHQASNWYDVARLDKVGKSQVMKPITPRDSEPPGGDLDKPTK